MAMGRGLKVYHNLNSQGQVGAGPTGEEQPFSIVLEQRGKSDMLLLECINDNYVVVTMGKKAFLFTTNGGALKLSRAVSSPVPQ
jgi:hypothetical protein